MKIIIGFTFISLFLLSCGAEKAEVTSAPAPKQIKGTWQLVTATVIEKGDTTVTDYTKKISFIKIINDTHFAFLQHDLNKGKDSAAVLLQAVDVIG